MRGAREFVSILAGTLCVAVVTLGGCQQAPPQQVAAPAPSTPAPAPAPTTVYDPVHKDSHRWDDREARAYQRWEAEKRREHEDYARRRPDEQSDYWNWRHSHAEDTDQQASPSVYDTTHRDNHNWDDRESAAYQRWETERSKPHEDFTRRAPDEQNDYWNWRHSHPEAAGQQAPGTVYDTAHRDNHNWDDREAAAYQRWESERNKPHDDFSRRNPDEQRDYWNWRHSQTSDSESQGSGRVFDPDHKDYHQWDDREAHAYQQWESDRGKQHQDFSRRNPDEQRDYWNWRHAHPDSGDRH